MAKQAGGEASKPLIFALIFFVLLTLGLGYGVYAMSEAKTDAQTKAKKAEEDAKTATAAAAKAKDEVIIYRLAMGVGDTAKDLQDLAGSSNGADAKRVHAELMKLISDKAQKAIDAKTQEMRQNLALKGTDVYNWASDPNANVPQNAPAQGLVDRTVGFYSQLQLAKNTYDSEQKTTEEMRKTLQGLSVSLEKALQDVKAAKDAIPVDIGRQVAAFAAEFEKYKKSFADKEQDSRTTLAKKDEDLAAKNLEVKRAAERVERVTQANNDLLAQQENVMDPFQFDKPHGKVIRRNGNVVEIDIGTASNLRVGLTFSVMPSDTPQRGFESRMRRVMDRGVPITRIVPKGSIEVVEILGPNLASCRVTGEESEVRDRILAGDLLYNAVWRKGQSEHIVLFGIFDIDGDGRDDINAVAAELTKMGVKVDAVFDLTENKWKGGAITSQTTLAVEGFSPSVTAADGNRDGKTKVINAITDARREVKDKGIRVLRPRDFFPRVGYKARLDLTEDTINQAATYYIRGISSEPEPKN